MAQARESSPISDRRSNHCLRSVCISVVEEGHIKNGSNDMAPSLHRPEFVQVGMKKKLAITFLYLLRYSLIHVLKFLKTGQQTLLVAIKCLILAW